MRSVGGTCRTIDHRHTRRSRASRENLIAQRARSELVRKGILPKPLRLTGGCVRWCWQEVTIALSSLKGTAEETSDPYLAAVQRGEQK